MSIPAFKIPSAEDVKRQREGAKARRALRKVSKVKAALVAVGSANLRKQRHEALKGPRSAKNTKRQLTMERRHDRSIRERF